jgi:predicted RNA-binding Zn-ribbon protein involved in translation (DUF1610 family)
MKPKQKTYKCRKCKFTTPHKWAIAQHYRWKHQVKHPTTATTTQIQMLGRTTRGVGHSLHLPNNNQVNYCPNCGCNLKPITVALNLS